MNILKLAAIAVLLLVVGAVQAGDLTTDAAIGGAIGGAITTVTTMTVVITAIRAGSARRGRRKKAAAKVGGISKSSFGSFFIALLLYVRRGLPSNQDFLRRGAPVSGLRGARLVFGGVNSACVSPCCAKCSPRRPQTRSHSL